MYISATEIYNVFVWRMSGRAGVAGVLRQTLHIGLTDYKWLRIIDGYSVLVRTVDDVITPFHALLTLHRTMTSVDDRLSEVVERVLNQIAKRILHTQKHRPVIIHSLTAIQ